MCAILLMVLALALAACGDDDGGDGGGGGDSEAVAESMRAYLTAYSEGEGAEACSHLTDGAQQALAEFATKAGAGASCAEILSQPGQQGSDILGPLIEGIDSEDVTVDGDTAELTIEGTQVPATLEQVDGEWLITEGYVRESFQLGGS